MNSPSWTIPSVSYTQHTVDNILGTSKLKVPKTNKKVRANFSNEQISLLELYFRSKKYITSEVSELGMLRVFYAAMVFVPQHLHFIVGTITVGNKTRTDEAAS